MQLKQIHIKLIPTVTLDYTASAVSYSNKKLTVLATLEQTEYVAIKLSHSLTSWEPVILYTCTEFAIMGLEPVMWGPQQMLAAQVIF